MPLSTTAPDAPQDYHHQLILALPPPRPWEETSLWVKADMLATVSFDRLDLFRTGRDQYGKRKYLDVRIPAEDLAAVRLCIARALGVNLT